jgi:cell wall-associated NlpC family hydrolase
MADLKFLTEHYLLLISARLDRRFVPAFVDVEPLGGASGGVRISGFSMFPHTDTFLRDMAKAVFGRRPVEFDLKVLVTMRPRFFEVATTSVKFYDAPKQTLPGTLTEALFGSVFRVFFKRGRYWYAQHPDGYCGYVPDADLTEVDEARYLRWKNGECAIALEPLKIGGCVVAPASRFVYEDNRAVSTKGRKYDVPRDSIRVHKPVQPKLVAKLRKAAEAFSRTKYLWGGKTVDGIDCSGFMQTLFLQQGIFLPRDASMQAAVGEVTGILPDRSDLLPGDLIFFINAKGKLYHVGVYVGNNEYLHSSRTYDVGVSSFATKHGEYSQTYDSDYAFGRRVHLL